MTKNYQKYTSEDLAQDVGFISWVRNKSAEEDMAFWNDFVEKHPDRRDEIETAIALVNSLSAEESKPAQKTIDLIWTSLDKKIIADKKAAARKAVVRKISFSLAAVLAIFLAGWWLLFYNPGEIKTAFAESKEILLPDNSEIVLNAASSIEYDKESYNSEHRTIQLKGEAYFDVKKGKPFEVQTKLGKVEVIGTSFNVFVRENILEVSCGSGMVKVTDKNQSHEIIIAKGQGVRMKGKKAEEFLIEDYKVGSWISGLLYFNASPVADVFDELERQFDVDIDLNVDGNKDLYYTGYFRNDNLDSALYNVCWPLRLKTEKTKNKIVVSRE